MPSKRAARAKAFVETPFVAQAARRLRGHETGQWIAEERIRFVSVAIPRAVLIAYDLHRYHDATRPDVVLSASAHIHKLPVRAHGELRRAHEFPVLQNLDLVLARILIHLEIIRRAKLWLLVPDHRLDAEHAATVGERLGVVTTISGIGNLTTGDAVCVATTRAIGHELSLVVEICDVLAIIHEVRRASEPSDEIESPFRLRRWVTGAEVHDVVIVEIADWQRPVVVNIISEVVFELRQINHADMELLDLEFAGKQRRISALKFVLEINLESGQTSLD